MSTRGAARVRRAELLRPAVRIHREVVERALEEIARNPDIEVGGKFVGYVEDVLDPAAPDWADQVADLRITILGYLDVGPRADRSAVHHLSDTAYQFALFRRLLEPFPDLRFLGIWHSHHPNGLDELSTGDDRTGRRTVDSEGHDLSFLLSFLAVDGTGLLGGRFYTFLRGHPGHYELDPGAVEVFDGRNPLSARIDRHAAELHERFRPGAAPPADGDGAVPDWPTTPFGQETLRADRAWLAQHPGMRPYRRDGSIVWHGRVGAAQDVDCEYAYPAGFPDRPPYVTLSTDGGRVHLRAELADGRDRGPEFARVLACLAELAGGGTDIASDVGAAEEDGEP